MARTTKTTVKKSTEGWDTTWHAKFLEALRLTCSPARAARIAGIERTTAYRHRNNIPDFSEKWDAAIAEAVELLEAEGWARAKKTSDTLLIFLLKAHRPEMYRERYEVKHSGHIDVTKLTDEELERIATGAS